MTIWIIAIALISFLLGLTSRVLHLFFSVRRVDVFANTRINPDGVSVTRKVRFVPLRNRYVMFVWLDGKLSEFCYESVDANNWTQERLRGLLNAEYKQA